MQKGITLIELIVVIIILGILSLIAIPRFTSTKAPAQESILKNNLYDIRSSIVRHSINYDLGQATNKYPNLSELKQNFSYGFPFNPVNNSNSVCLTNTASAASSRSIAPPLVCATGSDSSPYGWVYYLGNSSNEPVLWANSSELMPSGTAANNL